MDEQLKRQIEKRKAEAREKKIREKAGVIARGLGQDDSRRYGRDEITEFLYDEKPFEIKHYLALSSEGRGKILGRSISVKFNGKEVYEVSGINIKSYIPGEWEKLFNDLYERAIPEEEKREVVVREQNEIKRKDEKARERMKWGL